MKNIKVIFLGILASSLLINNVHAGTIAYISGDEVRLRTGAGTNTAIAATVNNKTTVTLNSVNKVTGIGCASGWYSINYLGKNLYVCSDYLSLKIEESTDYRPWTTPEKAIYGGAKFISTGYIAQGQNTSYLKKFNVNPNSSYNLYNHQYMANLAAPFNEAYQTFRSYKENNLLSLALNFQIPIFNNMPAKTSHPVYGEEKGGTSKITDEAFEKKLTEQGFDETYKVWLREIHELYPLWTFTSLKTNIDFNKAVETEKMVSSISSCEKCFETPKKQTEPGWYIANKQTVEYFLDPRNFLGADSILMFEDLSYNERYNEAVVKSVLKNTFMEGKSPVDNKEYASIFVSAGKKHNVSPVYLAALAKQESGVKGGLTTNGEKFEYKGNTYEGFYNFFNIGAYSSEENPAKAGLVYASLGAEKDSKGVFVGTVIKSENNLTPTTTPLETSKTENKEEIKMLSTASHLTNMSLTKKGNYITNINLNMNVGELKAKTTASEVTFKNANNVVLKDTEKLTTGSIVTFKNGEKYEIVIYGDLSKDGKISLVDLQMLKMYLLGKEKLTDVSKEAAKVVDKNKTNPGLADLQKIKFTLLNKDKIVQG